MSYILRATARLMGRDQGLQLSPLWYENDGIVNTISMDGPHNEPIIQYSNTPIKGKWQHMGILSYDHHQILLRRMNQTRQEELLNIYIKHCQLLYSL